MYTAVPNCNGTIKTPPKVASILNTSMNSSPESGITNIITNNYYTGAGGSDQQADTVFGSDFANLGLEYANNYFSLASKA